MNNNNHPIDVDLYEEPYVGMPINSLNRMDRMDRMHRSTCPQVDQCPLAMAYVPWQYWNNTYELEVGFKRGTIFPELDKPWEVR